MIVTLHLCFTTASPFCFTFASSHTKAEAKATQDKAKAEAEAKEPEFSEFPNTYLKGNVNKEKFRTLEAAIEGYKQFQRDENACKERGKFYTKALCGGITKKFGQYRLRTGDRLFPSATGEVSYKIKK